MVHTVFRVSKAEDQTHMNWTYIENITMKNMATTRYMIYLTDIEEMLKIQIG